MIDIIGALEPGAVTPTGEPISLQKQLIGRLQQGILSGRLSAGSLLPSSRALAEELGVSRNTVVIAYDHLAAEGYVLANRQGTRVTSLASYTSHAQEPDAAWEPVSLARRLAPFVEIRPQSSSEALLLPGMPALDLFPLAAWRRSLLRATGRALPQMLGYGTPAGEPALRDAIAAHLHITRGVRCDGSQVVITEGTQEALNLCVTLLTNPGDIAWVEDPGYRGAKAAFYAGDLRTIPVRVDQDGLAVPPETWRNSPPTLIYTSPAHQYPTGAVLSIARRLELIAQAKRVGAWLIEDDYDSEFRHAGEPIASMHGLVPDAPVLYIGSFSKTMFPALRIGFVVLPRSVISQAQSTLHELLRGGHRFEQLALADFINSGEFGRHLGRMRRLYRERQLVLREALTKHFAQSQILGGHSGMHLTLRLPPQVDDRTVVTSAQPHGIAAHALSTFTIAPIAKENGLVIGYGNTHAEAIPGAVSTLAQLAQKAALS
ncbi:MocR-like pyridoxine biosynthesis transcription factor PdxR [Dickeya zeae]|uniref:MocR-like pyridoxine biosynthesis transcription factor PdxR n=1 Tax=Dickeya zeae TaxID=204042 RepID=UPI001C62605F|nr:PLP-dependent aminotransferase family protein [Dickeya zeae]MCO7261536.1 PLP-dependent aminotransferase family protein [Dickeya zeae]